MDSIIPRMMIMAVVLSFWIQPALACDGTPPKLLNKDQQAHQYELQCGNKTAKKTIPAGGTQTLKNKSGCKIKLGNNPPVKLHTEMECTVNNGKLICDLL